MVSQIQWNKVFPWKIRPIYLVTVSTWMLERSIQWSLWWPFLGTMFVLKSTWMAPSGIMEHDSLGKSTSNSTHSKLNSRSLLSPQSPCPPEIYFSSYVPCLSILYHCPRSYAQARILNIKCIFPSPHSGFTIRLSSSVDFPDLLTSLYFLQYHPGPRDQHCPRFYKNSIS